MTFPNSFSSSTAVTPAPLRRSIVSKVLCVLSVGILMTGCSSQPDDSTPATSAADVKITDQELEIHGYIDEATLTKIRALSTNYSFSRVRVKIEGGEPLATMQLGYFIHRRQLDLVVDQYCLGACANYLFTAAKTKYLGPESIVAWSNGARSSSWTQQNQRFLFPGARFVAEQYLDSFLRRENRFFERIGVDQAVTEYGYAQASGCSAPQQGFYYTIPELLRFGIANVVPAHGDWRTAFDHYPDSFCRVDLSNEIDVIRT